MPAKRQLIRKAILFAALMALLGACAKPHDPALKGWYEFRPAGKGFTVMVPNKPTTLSLSKSSARIQFCDWHTSTLANIYEVVEWTSDPSDTSPDTDREVHRISSDHITEYLTAVRIDSYSEVKREALPCGAGWGLIVVLRQKNRVTLYTLTVKQKDRTVFLCASTIDDGTNGLAILASFHRFEMDPR